MPSIAPMKTHTNGHATNTSRKITTTGEPCVADVAAITCDPHECERVGDFSPTRDFTSRQDYFLPDFRFVDFFVPLDLLLLVVRFCLRLDLEFLSRVRLFLARVVAY